MTRTGDREIGVVSGRLPDNTGELACMVTIRNNIATMLQRCVALKIVLANRLV